MSFIEHKLYFRHNAKDLACLTICVRSVTSVMSDSPDPVKCIALQTPLSLGFSRQEYWSGLPGPAPGDLPHTGTEPTSPALQAGSLPLNHWGSPVQSYFKINCYVTIGILILLTCQGLQC